MILFDAEPDMVSQICASLITSPQTKTATPLVIVVSAAIQMESADNVRKAFRAAAERAS